MLQINYKNPAKKIEALIRALNPFVLARTNFRGTTLKILTAEVIDENLILDKPLGTIFKSKMINSILQHQKVF